MATHWSGIARRVVSVVLVLAASSTASWAHVELDSPNGGESLVAGSTYTIRWHPSVGHETVNWDLWYSVASSSGPWTSISQNLPVGDPSTGAPHSYQWLVPNVFDTTAWVRVIQDNIDEDYDDVSNASFSIFAGGDFNENGQVNSGDLVNWEAGYGRASNALHIQGDSDQDGDVDGRDFLVWQRQASGSSNLVVAQSVPEPTGLLLGLSCIAAWRICRPTALRD